MLLSLLLFRRRRRDCCLLYACMAVVAFPWLVYLSICLSVAVHFSLTHLLGTQELLKNTAETHTDYVSIKQALGSIQEMTLFINESKRDADNFQRVLEIQLQLQGELKVLIFVCLFVCLFSFVSDLASVVQPRLHPSQARRLTREGSHTY